MLLVAESLYRPSRVVLLSCLSLVLFVEFSSCIAELLCSDFCVLFKFWVVVVRVVVVVQTSL